MAVSYTHLDVYKRQGLDDGKARVLCTAAAAHYLRDEAEHVLVGAEALCEQQ